jgi:hypothetical protein
LEQVLRIHRIIINETVDICAHDLEHRNIVIPIVSDSQFPC